MSGMRVTTLFWSSGWRMRDDPGPAHVIADDAGVAAGGDHRMLDAARFCRMPMP